MAERGIYVERLIRGSLEEVWRLTQTPEVHQRWDLRFSTIEYLPRPDPAEPQRFSYVTRLLGPLAIRGWGESTGERITEIGEASSALRFGSEQRWSLIRMGSGYWRYVPVAEGVRFLTWYSYEVRFGWMGRLVDRVVLRPAMGWATAWSFDRLRLWMEEAQTPETSMLFAAVHGVARMAVAGTWLWHGLVPKLLFGDAGERMMVAQAGLPPSAVWMMGWLEIAWGVLMLVGWRWRWMFLVNVVAMAAALVGVMVKSPEFVTQAFNPVTLNGSVIALSVIGWMVARRVPTAAYCQRAPRKEGA